MALTQVDQGLLGTYAQYTGFKNRIINGAMVIDQRNAGAQVTPSSGAYFLDRWNYNSSQASKFTAQQLTSSPPAGFTNYMAMVSTAATSLGAGDYFNVGQRIEGYNISDLVLGSASGSSFTISFWVKCSLTGTFSGSLGNSGFDTGYGFTYTISSANTWTYITVTIPPTSLGSWNTTNGLGLRVYFSLGVGSTYGTTANTWVSAGSYGVASGVNVAGTNGATFYITGVQLEKGSTATSFDYRPYGTELQLCQRYYYVVASQAAAGNQSLEYCVATFYSATELDAFITFPVSMRTNPTLVQTSGTAYYGVDKSAPGLTFSSWTGLARAGANSGLLYISGLSGWTAGYSSFVYTNNNSAYIAVSAEL
jgi:hypothetical protein